MAIAEATACSNSGRPHAPCSPSTWIAISWWPRSASGLTACHRRSSGRRPRLRALLVTEIAKRPDDRFALLTTERPSRPGLPLNRAPPSTGATSSHRTRTETVRLLSAFVGPWTPLLLLCADPAPFHRTDPTCSPGWWTDPRSNLNPAQLPASHVGNDPPVRRRTAPAPGCTALPYGWHAAHFFALAESWR